VATLAFLVTLGLAWQRQPGAPSLEGFLVSDVANFFDALGIGNFATTTPYLKFRRLTVDDGMIPATMMVGYALPTVTEAFVFTNSVKVDPVLLVVSIGVCVAGAIVGVLLAARLPVNPIRIVMGLGLLVAAAGFTLSNLGLMPPEKRFEGIHLTGRESLQNLHPAPLLMLTGFATARLLLGAWKGCGGTREFN